jgi:hypothetical protein
MPNLSGDHMLVFDSGGDGSFTLAVPVEETGVYNLALSLARSDDYGIVELEVNGEAVGVPVDTFLDREELSRPIFPPEIFNYVNVSLKSGINTFRFFIRSKNPKSKGYRMGIDCLKVEKPAPQSGRRHAIRQR